MVGPAVIKLGAPDGLAGMIDALAASGAGDYGGNSRQGQYQCQDDAENLFLGHTNRSFIKILLETLCFACAVAA